MKQRILSRFQDCLIQYISHQYQDPLYCSSSQYILSTYNSQHNNNNNVVLAMTMSYSGQGSGHSARPWPLYWHSYIFNPDHYFGIVIANTTLLYKWGWSNLGRKENGAKRPGANGNRGETTHGANGIRSETPGFTTFLMTHNYEWRIGVSSQFTKNTVH
jgi:hypothetical protein